MWRATGNPRPEPEEQLSLFIPSVSNLGNESRVKLQVTEVNLACKNTVLQVSVKSTSKWVTECSVGRSPTLHCLNLLPKTTLFWSTLFIWAPGTDIFSSCIIMRKDTDFCWLKFSQTCSISMLSVEIKLKSQAQHLFVLSIGLIKKRKQLGNQSMYTHS